MFQHFSSNHSTFLHLVDNTPDVVIIIKESSEVHILEVGCSFDSSMEEAFYPKVVKYQALLNTISEL